MKNILTVVTKDEHKFMLNKYKELKEALNQRNKILMKNLNKIIESKKLNNLLTDRSTLNRAQGLELLNEENQSLNTCLKISEDLKKIGVEAEDELNSQAKTLKKNMDKVSLIISKVPGINKVMSSIKFHKYKEKIILGVVIGCILFLGLYLTYY